eukprot:CAMPEP_0118641732 /NCGR_PEP_ID=MMETSP0785-20121206/5457_1 /TAXON_ID=91992 /ORGANISM="Bolidomonas pacifica, Strain CCMP 1866" /LENGTH=438 /DNA_ID=CAMNT_0006533233 /DNA_START=77 /DNA_END=1390 /DNA_ORIENTATION=+
MSNPVDYPSPKTKPKPALDALVVHKNSFGLFTELANLSAVTTEATLQGSARGNSSFFVGSNDTQTPIRVPPPVAKNAFGMGGNLIRSAPKKKRKNCGGGNRWTREEDEQLRTAVAVVGLKNWKLIATNYLGDKRTSIQCLNRWKKVLEPGLVKGPFTKEEDRIIIDCMNAGVTKWFAIADRIPGRIGKQCRERWFNHLDPTRKIGAWTKLEDAILTEAHEIWGNTWTKISRLLVGRPENAVKNHWHCAAMRRARASNGPESKETKKYLENLDDKELSKYIDGLDEADTAAVTAAREAAAAIIAEEKDNAMSKKRTEAGQNVKIQAPSILFSPSYLPSSQPPYLCPAPSFPRVSIPTSGGFDHNLFCPPANVDGKNKNFRYKYECTDCPFKSKLKRNLKLHRKCVHGDDGVIRYKCQDCDYKANYKNGLKNHRAKKHNS